MKRSDRAHRILGKRDATHLPTLQARSHFGEHRRDSEALLRSADRIHRHSQRERTLVLIN